MTPELQLKMAQRMPWLINYREAREGVFKWERFDSIPKARRDQLITDDQWSEIEKEYSAPPTITFSCFGFSSSEAFLIKCGRQLCVGSITEDFVERGVEQTYTFYRYDFFWEHYVARENYIDAHEVPSPDAIIAEYKRQYAQKGVDINQDIKYAG
jgi:hypothetical protein